MSTYYIDPYDGSAENDGLSPESAVTSPRQISPAPGDRILLRRGTVLREPLFSPDGTPDAPIIWGAYGDLGNCLDEEEIDDEEDIDDIGMFMENRKPVVLGSLDYTDPDKWKYIGDSLWEAKDLPRDEVGNIMIDGGRRYGTLRWSTDDLCEYGDFWFSHYGVMSGGKGIPDGEEPRLIVCAADNPGTIYDSIELCVWGGRQLAHATHDVIFTDIRFMGCGVHGFAAADSERISLIRCSFEGIGGCVWSADRKIRFGNAVEFWRGARDIRVEDCFFRQIYDSCVTTQGAGEYPPPERISVRGNLFMKYGMAAYELRDVVPREAVFADNECKFAGCGFAMRGDLTPRRSEIWPRPMGHHIFAWRIEKPTENGAFRIRHNYFGGAPVGCAEYSLISPEAERQLLFLGNDYSTGSGERRICRNDVYVTPTDDFDEQNGY